MPAGCRAGALLRSLSVALVVSSLGVLTARAFQDGPVAARPAEDDAIDARAIDTAVWEEMQRQRVVGVAVAVVRNRKISFVRGYGFADREACEPVTSKTLFRLASLSKPITAIAAMQLVESGKLDLDADIRTYVPEFPAHEKPITSRQLLSHQSGIPHDLSPTRDQWREWFRDREHDPATDVIRALPVFADKPLVYPPGQQYHYSTPGFILLSAVVQRAGGAPFVEQVQSRIAEPLGIRSLQPDRAWRRLRDRAAGYRRARETIVRVRTNDVSWKLGGGGFCANISDAARLAEGILDGKLLNASSYDLMWTSLYDSGRRDTHYGLGFQVRTEPNGRRRISHDGAQEKTRTRIVLYPDEGFGVVVFSNCEYAEPNAFVTAVESAARGE